MNREKRGALRDAPAFFPLLWEACAMGAWFETLQNKFYNDFIKDDRWRYLVGRAWA